MGNFQKPLVSQVLLPRHFPAKMYGIHTALVHATRPAHLIVIDLVTSVTLHQGV